MLGRVAVFKFNFVYMTSITLFIMDVINNPFNIYLYFGKISVIKHIIGKFIFEFYQTIEQSEREILEIYSVNN